MSEHTHKVPMGPLWTIDELGAEVALALSIDYEGQSNGQIRDVPNRRTIRYYGTLGLIDRPATMRGRTAFYGRRHLMQLVAIKRLQREGLSLAAVQQRLAGATDLTLSGIARVPEPISEGVASSSRHAAGASAELEQSPTGSTPRPGAVTFWETAPAELSAEASAMAPGFAGDAEPPRTLALPELKMLQALSLSADVQLLMNVERPLERDDVEAITAAAAPLLSLLRARGLAR